MRLRARRPSIFCKDPARNETAFGFPKPEPVIARPPIQSEPAKNFYLGQAIGASHSIEPRGCNRNGRQLPKPSQRKFARRHPEAGRAAVRFQLAAPSQSKENGMHPTMRIHEMPVLGMTSAHRKFGARSGNFLPPFERVTAVCASRCSAPNTDHRSWANRAFCLASDCRTQFDRSRAVFVGSNRPGHPFNR